MKKSNSRLRSRSHTRRKTTLTFKQLQYFLEVARTLNFSKAAKALYVSQSALSKSISQLEAELGAILFIRDHHNVKLTPAGIVLATNLPRLQEELNQIIDLVVEVKEGTRGRLALGIHTGLTLPETITSAVAYCASNMPFLTITCVSMDDADLKDSLANGKIDFAFEYLLENEIEEKGKALNRIILETSPVVLCVSGTREKVSDNPTRSELSRLHYVMTAPEKSPYALAWHDYCRSRGFLPDVSYTDAESAVMEVEMGLAATIVSESHVLARSENIRALPIPDAYRVSVVMSWNPDNLNQIVGIFTKMIEADLS